MCGEIDEHSRIDELLFERFVASAAERGAVIPQGIEEGSMHLDSPEARRAYLEQRFNRALSEALSEAFSLPEGERMDGVAGQAILLARLAGYLAGQIPPEADLFRSVISALMDGNRESQNKEAA